MHNQLNRVVVRAFALLVVLLAAGSALYAQTCTDKLELARQRVQQLEATINDQKDQVRARDEKIKDQRVIIDLQDQKIDKQRETIANLDNTIADLKKQISILEDNVKLTQQNAQSQQAIVELNKAFIAVQTKAIDALLKSGKRSALEKFVDALPSIAGIIAVALTHTR
ncbi:MAG TPA: hypothetical protein VN476_13880 [Pyrinomonadaceae bacterium]|nr:hypothetical protein [Pyrinomonadaceae bacterium]